MTFLFTTAPGVNRQRAKRYFDAFASRTPGRFLLSFLLAGAVFITACSGSSGEEYVDVYRELISDHATNLANLGTGPTTIDIWERSTAPEISNRLQELRAAADEANALQDRWGLLEPPIEFRSHYELVVKVLDKTAEGFAVAVEAFEELDREVDRFIPRPGDANVLLQSSRTLLAEADVFAAAVNKEISGLFP
ncbi:MAG: hypothetical protein IIB27_07840 [Chloroflexi bacterium]|nr:hypothetical protein [Chloroflexota bacterium]